MPNFGTGFNPHNQNDIESRQPAAVEGHGTGDNVVGVLGTKDKGEAIVGIANNGTGVTGIAEVSGTGVLGRGATGVHGTSTSGDGVHGTSTGGNGVHGTSTGGNGVSGDGLNGVQGTCNQANGSGVFGENKRDGVGIAGVSNSGIGVLGIQPGSAPWGSWGSAGAWAGFFSGNVKVTGNVNVDGDVYFTVGQDCAEDFDVEAGATVAPGTVMVIGEDGRLHESRSEYATHVAGIISGAGSYRPALVLGRSPHGSGPRRAPIALSGKVFCLVDASHGAIGVGDLLTTSPTPGHAMRVSDRGRAVGAILGKALDPLPAGAGLVRVLVALQ